MLELNVDVRSFEQLYIFHVARVLLVYLALVKVLTMHTVSAVFILVHI